MRVITLDIEVAEPVNDWDAAKRGECGISSLALYDTTDGKYTVYFPRLRDLDYTASGEPLVVNYDWLQFGIDHINRADVIVTWNGIGFDVPVLENVSGFAITPKHYDLLAEAWSNGARKFGKGWGLGPTAERTIGSAKSGTGEHAPKLFKEGRWGELISYNISDVTLTRDLANFVRENRYLIAPDGSEFPIPNVLESPA